MDIHELKCFQAVYQEHSMNQAAKRLYITSQGLGRIIQNLEQELEVSLFTRSARGVEPTEAAGVLYRNTARLLDEFETVKRAVRQHSTRETQLKVSCARGTLNALSFQVLLDFIGKNPDLQVTWKEASNGQVKHEVAVMDADVGLVVGNTGDAEVAEQFLDSKEVRILVYRQHPYFERESISLAELREEKLLILNEQYQVYHDFCASCSATGFAPHIVGMTEDSHFLYKLCKQRQGLGVVLDFSVDEFRLEDVRAIPLEEPIPWDVYLIYRKSSGSYPNIRRFREFFAT